MDAEKIPSRQRSVWLPLALISMLRSSMYVNKENLRVLESPNVLGKFYGKLRVGITKTNAATLLHITAAPAILTAGGTKQVQDSGQGTHFTHNLK